MATKKSGRSIEEVLYLMITAPTPAHYEAARALAHATLGSPAPITDDELIPATTPYQGIQIDADGNVSTKPVDATE